MQKELLCRLPLLCYAFISKLLCCSPDSIFASRDIREVPREEVVAYARALQYWAEQNDLPTGGEPCLLVKGILELR